MAPHARHIICCVLGLSAPVSSTRTAVERRTLLSAWSAEADGIASDSTGPTPIQRVTKLLEEMKAELSKEAQEDSDTYAKLSCWCDGNEKAKAKAIDDADATMNELMSQVESLSARNADSGAKIDQLKKDIGKKGEALKALVAIREKEHAEFDKGEVELAQSVQILKAAIAVLSKRQAGLLQVSPAVEASISSGLRWVALRRAELDDARRGAPGSGKASRTEAALLATAAGSGAASTDQVVALEALRAPGSGSAPLPVEYALRVLSSAASGAPSSLLQQARPGAVAFDGGQVSVMTCFARREEFQLDMSEAQKAELKAREEFEALKAASEDELAAHKATLDDLEAELSTNVKGLSDAKEDLGLTRQQRSEDVEFLRNLKLQCQDLDHEYEQRSRARGEEIQAVADAIAILAEDGSRELLLRKFGTGGASLLQRRRAGGAAARARRGRAAAVLLRAARQARRSPAAYQVWRSSEEKPHDQLAAVAVQVQLDAFAQVKKAIDDMVASLKTEQSQEVKKKAYCTAELGENEKQTYKTGRLAEDLKDKVAELADTIQKLEDGIAAAQAEIARLAVEVKKASEARQKENLEFQSEVTDQRAVQTILRKVIDRLTQVFKKREGVAALQDAQTPPAQFQPYKQHQGGSKVVALISTIVEDSAAVEKEAMASEQAAQKAYESFVNDSTASTKSLQEAIASKTKTRAAAAEEKADVASRLASARGVLEDLAQQLADLRAECDFLLQNFDVRQDARLKEIEALGQAKGYLSGMVDDDPLE
ncbi:unnamed protein product [Prorocentrum cordatum]|uniref:Uncharacterized protein n=2 Tax=Prorocentrum cordatum TaxID=2364126 RepID=A0ABN9Y307_9DINO|nr:unnamed protein product [Polarella glacialis]